MSDPKPLTPDERIDLLDTIRTNLGTDAYLDRLGYNSAMEAVRKLEADAELAARPDGLREAAQDPHDWIADSGGGRYCSRCLAVWGVKYDDGKGCEGVLARPESLALDDGSALDAPRDPAPAPALGAREALLRYVAVDGSYGMYDAAALHRAREAVARLVSPSEIVREQDRVLDELRGGEA